MGLPVIIPENISDDSEIIENNEIGSVIHSLDKIGYEMGVRKMNEILKSKSDLNQKIRNIALKYRDYSIAEKIYHTIYSSDSKRP